MHPHLRDELLAEAEAVGLRLRSCVNEILGLDPTHSADTPTTAKAISALLEIDSVIAKRLVKMCRPDLSPMDVCTSAPSPANLRRALDAARVRQLDPLSLWAIEDAIKKFERLIESAAGPSGPKSELTKLLRASPPDTSRSSESDSIVRLPAHMTIDEGALVCPDARSRVMRIFHGNILHESERAQAAIELSEQPRALLTRSGTLAQSFGELNIQTWTSAGTHALLKACDELLGTHDDAQLFLMPARRDVLSDVQRTKAFFKARTDPRLRLALAPAHLMDPDSPRDMRDHLRRIFDTLIPLASVVLIHAPEHTPHAPNAELLLPHLDSLPPHTPIAMPPGQFGDTIQQQLGRD